MKVCCFECRSSLCGFWRWFWIVIRSVTSWVSWSKGTNIFLILFYETINPIVVLLCWFFVSSWTINTKYYTADVSICVTHLQEGFSITTIPTYTQLAALVMVFDMTDVCLLPFNLLCLLVIYSWCFMNRSPLNFELSVLI